MSGARLSFAAALALCLLAAWPAAAQNKQSIPKIGRAIKWQVAPIETAADEKRHFCSGKAGFDNGVTFIVARDTGGGQSLAFEFESAPFTAGATLPIVLHAGGVQVQSNALAATIRVVLLNLARDSDLQAGLSANGVLDMLVAGQRKVLAFGGFAAVLNEIDACLAGQGEEGGYAPVKIDAGSSGEAFSSMQMMEDRQVQRFSNVTPEEIRDFQPAEAARNAVLQAEIERLRRQNEELHRHRQQLDGAMVAAELGGMPVDAAMPQPATVMRSSKKITWPTSQSFGDAVATYLTTEAARCPGDFANTMGALHDRRNAPVQEAELACLGTANGRDYAAALIFIGGQGEIEVIVYQGQAGLIEQALQARAKTLATMGVAGAPR